MFSRRRLRVYLADDDKGFIRDVSRCLKDDKGVELIGTTHNGEKALRDILEHGPDVAILGTELPRTTGIQIIAALKIVNSLTRVLLVADDESNEAVIASLAAGAGYMLRDTDRDEICQAVKKIAIGEMVVGLLTAQARVEIGISSLLSTRELQIAKLLSEDFDTASIAIELCLAEGTIRKHVRTLCVKLGVNNPPGAVAEAIRRGLLN